MARAPDLERAATLLAEAWRTGTQFAELPPEARPMSIDDGYAAQDRLIALVGDEVVGWKLGAGSIKARRETGLGRSIAGRIVRSRLFAAGDAVPLHDDAPVTVEFEVAFVVGRTIEPGDDCADLAGLIAGTRMTCEFVRSRFVDRRAVGWPSFAADDAGFDALVVGPLLDAEALGDFVRALVVTVDGVERVRAAQGDDVTEPYAAFAGFLALARERGMRVPAGSIVSTGTQSVPFTINGPVALEARSGVLSLAFTTRR